MSVTGEFIRDFDTNCYYCDNAFIYCHVGNLKLPVQNKLRDAKRNILPLEE